MTARASWSARDGWPAATSVEDASQVAGARRLAVTAAAAADLSANVVDAVSLVATELAENLYRHAEEGVLFVVAGADGTAREGEVSLLAVDRGPGVHRFDRMLRDGISTAGTLGTGLGAVLRRCTHFDAYSELGGGTVVRAVFRRENAVDQRRIRFDVGALGLPVAGETENGDTFLAVQRDARITVMLADGLGHGALAARASRAATGRFETSAHLSPGAALAAVNAEMIAGRGTAATIVDGRITDFLEGGLVSTAGLGNVSVLVADVDGATKRIAVDHGTVGVHARSSTTQREHPLPKAATLVLHSDGLQSQWSLAGRGELLQHDAETIAAVLWRDHARDSDDSLVVVVKGIPWSES